MNPVNMSSRCDVCHDAFTIIMKNGKLVDPYDETRHVQTKRGKYVHARCEEEVNDG